jgi:hypothetical protein
VAGVLHDPGESHDRAPGEQRVDHPAHARANQQDQREQEQRLEHVRAPLAQREAREVRGKHAGCRRRGEQQRRPAKRRPRPAPLATDGGAYKVRRGARANQDLAERQIGAPDMHGLQIEWRRQRHGEQHYIEPQQSRRERQQRAQYGHWPWAAEIQDGEGDEGECSWTDRHASLRQRA